MDAFPTISINQKYGIKMVQLNFDLFKKVPVVLQTETAECGLACIAMVFGYYNGDFNLFNLRSQYGSSSRGVNLQNLIDISRHLGLVTRPLSLELEEVKYFRLPCILHWDFNHFVVLTKVTGKHYIVHDPAFGKKKLTKAEFSNHFTGVALEYGAKLNLKRKKKKMKSAFMKHSNIFQALREHY